MDIRLRPCNKKLEDASGCKIERGSRSQVEAFLSQLAHTSSLSQACDMVGHKYTFTTMAGPMGTILQPKNDKEVSHLKGALTQCNEKKSEREIASTRRLFIPINIFLCPDYVQVNTEIKSNDIPCVL